MINAPLLILFLCFLSHSQLGLSIPKGPHINTLNVLLPPKATRPVRFRLQGSGGCFTWTWDHRDIIHVQPEFNGTDGCSQNAVISSISPYIGRRATAVYARDVVTGQVIRCEVFIDQVSRIKISHHSLKLDLDGLATMRIHAYDVEDNLFSSLVGVQFLWRFLPSESSKAVLTHCLVHVPLKDTALSDCGCVCDDIDTRIELEDKGSGSDLFVVRGVNVGHEKVNVNVLEATMEMLEDEVTLTVAEVISIEPTSPLYVLVDTQFQYILKTHRYKIPSVIHLPSAHHHWSVLDHAIAEVDKFMGTVSTKTVGTTSIVVEDIRLPGHTQISSLHVVIPSSLQLYLAPLSFQSANEQLATKTEAFICSSDLPWYLIMGWDYVVQVLAFSVESSTMPLYITQGDDLKLLFEEWPYWKAITIPEDVQHEQGWHNGTFIKAVSEGLGKLSASLGYRASLVDTKKALNIEQEIIVCSQVLILFENGEHANDLSLPWHSKINQEYHLKVEGGCGSQASDYQWLSMDPHIADINAFGMIFAKGEGESTVQVMARTNLMNADKVKVHISCPSSILRVEDLPVEVEVGSYLPAAVTLTDANGRYFSKCDSLSAFIEWKIISGEKVFVLKDNMEWNEQSLQDTGTVALKPICDSKHFLAVQPGRATITASLPTDEFINVYASKHSVSWTVSAYAPLTIFQAAGGQSYGGYDCNVNLAETSGNTSPLNGCQLKILQLVPKTSMRVLLSGGPERWGQNVDFIERHEVISTSGTKADSLHVSRPTSSGGSLYDIACGSIGNYTVIFYRGNMVGEGHPISTVASVNLTVICAIPSSITLIVDNIDHSLQNIKASAEASRDENFMHMSQMTVMSGSVLRVAAVAINAFGVPFANASSLSINWVLHDCFGLAYWQGHQETDASLENARWEENLVLADNSGQCLLNASVNLFKTEFLRIPTPMPDSTSLDLRPYILTDSVQLQIVASLRILPKFLLLYNHPEAKATFAVLGGSNRIEAYSNDSNVAYITGPPFTSDYSHMMVAARGPGTALITIQDVGLITPALDSALVSVADIAWVHLLLPDEASIEVGTILTVMLQVGDGMGNFFSESQMELMEFEVHIKDEILDLSMKKSLHKGGGNKIFGSSFRIKGVNVGVTDLYVSVCQKYGHEIISEIRKVEVYEPLSIQPDGLTLTPGAHYVVWVCGGPTFGTTMRFTSSNATIASVEMSLGIVTANYPGSLCIYAEATSHDGMVICKATLQVRVHVPAAMTLNVRGGRLAIGQKSSIYITGVKEDLFSFYELCGDYKWSVADPEVLALYTPDAMDREEKNELVFAESSLKGRFSVVIMGKSAGKTEIGVGFQCHFQSELGYSSTQFYTASGTVQVIHDLPLALGMCATLLLPPNYKSSSLLRQWSDTALEGTGMAKLNIIYSILQDSSRDPVNISLDGPHIRTSERKDIACIQARDRRTGRAEIAVCIRVAEVSQVIVGDNFRAVEMSVGSYQHFTFTLKDDIGTPFSEVGDVHMVAETNRMDIVTIKVIVESDDGDYGRNATVLIHALRQGTAMIRLSLRGNPSVSDYILVHVGASIIPGSPTLHVGGHVIFSVTGEGHVMENGCWISSNVDVIKINKHSGEAFAVGPGSTVVSYNSSRLLAYTTVNVIQIASIVLKAPVDLLTNVQVPESGYLFLVKFSDLQGQDVEAFATDQKISYTCRVDPPYIGRCLAWRDPKDGKSYCVLWPYSPERLFLTLQGLSEEAGSSLSVGDAKGFLTLKVSAEINGTSEIGSVLAAFTGGFKIRDKRGKILLTPTSNKTKLTVIGNAGSVVVSWSRNDLLEVKKISSDRDAYGFGGHALFELSVIYGEDPFISNIVFRLPSTGQIEEILVEYDLKDHDGRSLIQQIVTALIAIVVLGILPFIVCARVLDIPRHPRDSDSNAFEAENLLDSPRSPTNLGTSGFLSPQSVSLSRSPPQPYTEYVSKTIENTPYFRHEGMRRFDPSRTY